MKMLYRIVKELNLLYDYQCLQLCTQLNRRIGKGYGAGGAEGGSGRPRVKRFQAPQTMTTRNG